jgi:hypothetical protein
MPSDMANWHPCVYQKPYPVMISDLTGKIPVPEPEFPVPPK